MKVIVYGRVSDIGVRAHVVSAKSVDEAWGKFCRAYSKRKCTPIRMTTGMGAPVWSGGKNATP